MQVIFLFLGIGIGYIWASWAFVNRVRNGSIEDLIRKIREAAEKERDD
jgi:ABC-type sulfate transport system permease component